MGQKAQNLLKTTSPNRGSDLSNADDRTTPLYDENDNSLESIRMRRMGYVRNKRGYWVSAESLMAPHEVPIRSVDPIHTGKDYSKGNPKDQDKPSYYDRYYNQPRGNTHGNQHQVLPVFKPHGCKPATIRAKKAVARIRIVFRGQVQMVGFRSQTISVMAGFPDLTGFVMNMPDESVVCHMQGKVTDIRKAYQAIFDKIRSGIDKTEVKEIPIVRGESAFYQRGNSYAKSAISSFRDCRADTFREKDCKPFDYGNASYGGYTTKGGSYYRDYPGDNYYKHGKSGYDRDYRDYRDYGDYGDYGDHRGYTNEDRADRKLSGSERIFAEAERRFNQGDFRDDRFSSPRSVNVAPSIYDRYYD